MTFIFSLDVVLEATLYLVHLAVDLLPIQLLRDIVVVSVEIFFAVIVNFLFEIDLLK